VAIDLHPDIVAAINDFASTKLGHKFGRYARRTYHISGKKLLAKQTAGEFGGRSTKTGRGVVSSAGARGPGQFIPSTRAAFMQKYGIDPWRSDREAIKGMALHDLSTGVAGYNPGMSSYTGYVLGQKINPADIQALRTGGTGGGTRVQAGRPGSTKVGLPEYTIPGQSFEPERRAARRELLLGGKIDLNRLLAYKEQVNGLQDVDPRTVHGDLQVQRTPGSPTRYSGGPSSGVGAHVTPQRLKRASWGGSKLAGKALVKAAGLPVTSRKRSTMNTASGGISDHYDGNTDSYAWDLGVTGTQGTKIAAKLARMLGAKWNGGSWLNVTKTIGGVKYRFQLGWNVPDHYDHIHLGIDRVDTPG